MISIVIRSKNEERWIAACLRAVFDQRYKDFEVILVDNNSSDKTVAKASAFDVKIITVDEFRPGDAINQGIEASVGDIIVCLSAHCIPTSSTWLEALLECFDDENVAGVYGRQEPMAFTSDMDKRDLLTTFGLDRRVQVKDSFFHNANSAIRRSVWEEIPFDGEVLHIEDRVWAEAVLRKGYVLIYEPMASVFHYHGIHHHGNRERCADVVKILENLGNDSLETHKNTLDVERLNIVAIIPVRDENMSVGGRELYEYSIEHARKSRYVKQVFVSTDDEEIKARAIDLGASVPFLRDKQYSRFDVILERLMQYTLGGLEERGIFPDILVLMEITYPLREMNLIDEMILQLVKEGLDTVIPARRDYNSFWAEEGGSYKRIDEGYIPRQFKKITYTGVKGLGCVTHPAAVRRGQLFGERVGIYEVPGFRSCIEVRDPSDRALVETLMGIS